jgi:hypothetical protein
MNMTTHINDPQPTATGLPVVCYPPRWSDWDIEVILFWGRYCRMGDAASQLLAAYIAAVVSFEQQRRQLIAEGGEVLDASLPELPCIHWSNDEVARALGKICAIVNTIDGEPREFFRKLQACIIAETQWRLGLKG